MIKGKVGEWDWQVRPHVLEVSQGELGEPGYVWMAYRRTSIAVLEMRYIDEGEGENAELVVRPIGGGEANLWLEGTAEEVQEFCRAVGNWMGA